MSKILKNKIELLEDFTIGSSKLSDYVGSTLGPKGTTVLLKSKDGKPVITKDGVTVARFFSLPDPNQNAGVEIIKQASEKTNSEAGDGTTTTTILANSVLQETFKHIVASVPPIDIKRGMDKAVTDVSNYWLENASKIEAFEQLKSVATISANNDQEIGELIYQTAEKIGRHGAVTIENSRTPETVLEFIDGFGFDKGWVAQSFVNNELKQTVEYDNANLFITDKSLSTIDEMLPVLELAARDNKPFVIVAEEIEGQLLAGLIANCLRGSMKVVAIKAPYFGEEKRDVLQDLAIATGATFVTRESGMQLSEVQLKDFGRCKRIEIGKKNTIVIGGKGAYEKVNHRIESLKNELAQTSDISACKTINERITRLGSSVAIIHVGASTEIELIEKRHRVEDALEAVKAAQTLGIHSGGGVSYVNAYNNLKKKKLNNYGENIGYHIVLNSLQTPLRQLAINSNLSADLLVETVSKSSKAGYGFDFHTMKKTKMFESGVIEPVKVSICALKNAVSAVSTLILTNHSIIEV